MSKIWGQGPFDDNGAHAPNGRNAYFWYALPCTASSDKVSCAVADRAAISNDSYIGSFTKRSAPVEGLDAELRDSDTQALLRWGDALSAASDDTSGGTVNYQVQFTSGDDWSAATSVITDGLAFNTAIFPPAPEGSYRWRVRPFDGDGVALSWAEAPKPFELKGLVASTPPPSVPPTPTPTGSVSPTAPPQSTTNPTPSLTYDQNPEDSGGVGDIAPSKPGKPKVMRVSKKAIKVRWRASQAYSDPVTTYVVMRARDGHSFTQASRTPALYVRLTAKRGAEYSFYVVAVSAAGRSAQSATTTFTMPKR